MTEEQAINLMDMLESFIDAKLDEKLSRDATSCDDSWCGYVDISKERNELYEFFKGL